MKKGFTLIELLVVIAIIGILSSVVLASLNTARGKGSDAAIKSNLDNMRAEIALYYDTNSTYTTFCAGDSILQNASTSVAAQNGSGISCANATSGVTLIAKLNTTGNWCVDSNGYSGTTSSTTAVSGQNCK